MLFFAVLVHPSDVVLRATGCFGASIGFVDLGYGAFRCNWWCARVHGFGSVRVGATSVTFVFPYKSP